MPDQFPRIIYLSIIGFAALSYVLYAYRGRMGSALKAVAIWAMLFSGAVALYYIFSIFL